MISKEKKKGIINAFVYRKYDTSIIRFVERIAESYNEELTDVINVILNIENIKYLYNYNDINVYNERYFLYLNNLISFGIKCNRLLSFATNYNIRSSFGVNLLNDYSSMQSIIIYSGIYNHYKNLDVITKNINAIYFKYEDTIKIILSNKTIEEKRAALMKLDVGDLEQIKLYIDYYYERYSNKLDETSKQDILNVLLEVYYFKINQAKELQEDKKNKKFSSETYIKMFLSSGMCKTDWCNKVNVTADAFNKMIKRVKANNPELYEEYLIHKANEQQSVKRLAERISYYYKNGVQVSENEYRKFTILDYYFLTTIPIYDFYKLVKQVNLDVDVATNLKKFLTLYLKSIPITLKNVDNLNFYMNFGSQRRNLFPDEKEEIIKFFQENDIPFKDDTYMSLVSEYGAGRFLLPTHMKK